MATICMFFMLLRLTFNNLTDLSTLRLGHYRPRPFNSWLYVRPNYPGV